MEGRPTLVFFDLETTGLINPAIVQVGSVTFDQNETFDEFLTPYKPFETKASEVNNLSINRRGELVRDGQTIFTVRPARGLQEFVDWLTHDIAGPVVLVAYNGAKFDFIHLLNELSRCSITIPPDLIQGFLDPFLMLSWTHPNNPSMGQGTLLKHLGITPKGDAHNAIYDAENLRMATIALVEKMTGERDEDTCVEYLTRARETTAQKKQFYWTYQQMEEKVIQANLNVTKVTRE